MNKSLPPVDSPASLRRDKQRWLLDRAIKQAIALGGIGVVIAILLIFVYLAYIVYPLFLPGSIDHAGTYRLPGDPNAATLHLAIEEQNEVALRVTDNGRIVFFDTRDGAVIDTVPLPLPDRSAVTAFTAAASESRQLAIGFDDGRLLAVKHSYLIEFSDAGRTISPYVEYPLGDAAIVIDDRASPLTALAMQGNDDQTAIAALTADGRLLLTTVWREVSFLDDSVTWEFDTVTLAEGLSDVEHLLLDKDQRTVYAMTADQQLLGYDVTTPDDPLALGHADLSTPSATVTQIEFLAGDISVLVGYSDGRIAQWFPVRDDDGTPRLTQIRQFRLHTHPITQLAPEFYRKGFLAADSAGNLGLYHTTADRRVLNQSITSGTVERLAVSPRANTLLALDDSGAIHFWRIDNEHPEVSWSALWQPVWYESFDQAEYIWQSSAANNDFEPKFSLVPITFGTLKAAAFAMLFAIPLAIMGAIYTAYFMTPKMRAAVKPTIEIMEALPTVILGFLAGLWLAPLMEKHLPAVFTLILIMPLGVLAFAFAWRLLPGAIRAKVPDGWHAGLLIPVIIVIAWFAFSISAPLEQLLFAGEMRAWLDHSLGIDFDQRNAMVVGIAMGFAVIPTIFSITEDAVFGVPKHLINGSLALGATPWQTLTRVVILTASPGIFSAVMIGFGRAVGETMIVLMATGNTPVMDWSIFQGMRTLSANIAVEMPESEVHSTHYRVLFLTALVLFMFTFLLNTIAEVVRQRLRKRYSSL